MSNVAGNALLFLINTLFDLYLFILAIRLIFAYAGVNYFDPVTQFITKLTDPVVKPIRRFIPNVKSIELSTLLIIFLLEIIKYFLIIAITSHIPNLFGIFLLAIGDMVRVICYTFFYAIIAQVILSWAQPYSTVNRLLMQVVAPILQPFQRIIPAISGIDISPIFALILLQLIVIVIAYPLIATGMRIV